MSKQLAELLLKERIITSPQFTEATTAAQTGKSHVRYLIEKKIVSESKLLHYLGHKYGIPSLNLSKFEIPPEVIRLIPADLARKCNMIPIQARADTLVVAVADPTFLGKVEDIKFRTKKNVEAVLTTFSAFDEAMSKHYGGASFVGAALENIKKDLKKSSDDGVSIELVQVHDIDPGTSEDDMPVISLVNGILSEGIRRGVSDIHVEPYEKRFRVRMRVDGTLVEVVQIPIEMKRAVVARLKIMSRMDIAESRVPQDGRIKLKSGGTEIDFRVSSMPTLFGEKIVLRMLNQSGLQLDLAKLGFEPEQMAAFQKGVFAATGMVLVTGPTGSGKTTTLYSALAALNKVSDNISTVEDPVEYNLEGVNQVQVNKDVGLTFASVLRTLLRQDPDIILVGEIRDFETMEVAVQAALTGHLVLSTLHTNDAPSTLMRLMNMGLEPFLAVAAINTIIAQRLLRSVCPQCKYEFPIPPQKLQELGFSAEQSSQIRSYRGKGCNQCGQSGYKGRIAIYEILDFSPTLKEMLLRGESLGEIKKQALKEGMKTLRSSALTKFAEGRTSLEEALSMTMEN